jgi:uncharacterized surface protein with fasciclin (FAS1) repeats
MRLSLTAQNRNRRRAVALVAFSASAFMLFGCATSQAPAAPAVAVTSPQREQTIGEALRNDPRFSDYVDVVELAGLGHQLTDARDLTVFAPTNDAFERSDPSWRVHATPETASNGGAGAQRRQAILEQSGLQGVHPVADFAGRLQDVRAIDGRIFHVDGRVAGVITITTGDPQTLMGAKKTTLRVATAELPPIKVKDGLIYPVDTILVSKF